MSLASYLAEPSLKGIHNARVTMTLSVDNGRETQPFYAFRILTLKPIINLAWSTNTYACSITNNSDLLIAGTRNRIDIVKINRSAPSVDTQLSFDLVLDGLPLIDDNNRSYVFAVRASGPHIFRFPEGVESDTSANDYYAYSGIRYDLHEGNREDYFASYPETDAWLQSAISHVDVQLVDAEVVAMRTRPGYKHGRFS